MNHIETRLFVCLFKEMNKELELIQLSKYLFVGTISAILAMIIVLILLWIYSECIFYQQCKHKQLDTMRDKMDGIQLKRVMANKEQHIMLPMDPVSSQKNAKPISLKSLDGLQ